MKAVSSSGGGVTGGQSAPNGSQARRTVRITAQNGANTDSATSASTIRPTLGNIASRTHSSHHSGTTSNGEGYSNDSGNIQQKMVQLEEDLRRRQENFISRERAYKLRIDELEQELAAKREEKTGWMKDDTKIKKLKEMQSQILGNVALVQDRFSRIMREQEQDLLRSFKARLLDVQAELEMEKSKKDDGAVAFIEKSKSLELEVERQKEHADVKERQNQALLQANNRLKSQFASQEEDRNFLMSQLVAAQKDNSRLRSEHIDLVRNSDQLKRQIDELADRHANAASPMKETLLGAGLDNAIGDAQALQNRIDSEERYKEINQRLRRLLAEERKSLQQVRQNYTNELNARTDLEMLLRQCAEQVKKENQHRESEDAVYNIRIHHGSPRKGRGRTSGISAVDEEQERKDRERVLELLLSRNEVVQMIYSKQFNRSSSNNQEPAFNGSRQQSKRFDDGEFLHASSTEGGTAGRPVTTDGISTEKLPAISPHPSSSRLVSR